MAEQEQVEFKWDADRFGESERFGALLNKTDLRKELFNEKFIEALEKRRDALGERDRKGLLLTATAILFLGIALLSVNVPVALFGVSTTNAANLREVLLILLASIPLFNLFGSIEQVRIKDLMERWILKASHGNKDVQRALQLRYGLAEAIGIASLQNVGPALMTWPRWRKVRVVTAFVGGVLWIILTAGLTFMLEVFGLISILIHPTVSFGFSLLVVLYVICANCVNFGMRAVAGVNAGARPSLPPE